MDDEILIRLLQIEFEHNCRISKHEEVLNTDNLYIDLLSVVLDAIGVPADNSAKLDPEHPDFFCRDWHYFEFEEIAEGTCEECKAYLKAVREALEEYRTKRLQEEQVVLQQYKITLEFVLDVDELVEDVVRDIYKRTMNYEEIMQDPETWEHAERQRRLLHALLANPAVLQRFVRYKAVDLLETYGNDLVKEELAVEEEVERILDPILTHLNLEDATTFREAIEHGYFYESTEAFDNCFTIRLARANIDEIIRER